MPRQNYRHSTTSRRQVRHKNDLRIRKLALERLEDRCMLALIPPTLNSLVGAPVTIHLDFDGTPALLFQPSQNLWASGPAPGNSDPVPAFSIDANVNDFSQAELNGITAIWQHVAEKFSPFNINVTTVAPPNYNDLVAVQIVIGGSVNDWYNQAAGGVARRGSFTTSDVNTGFIFSADAFTAGSTTLSSANRHLIAEGAAHEAGHLFWLLHQSVVDASNNVIVEYSNGDANTTPIMGNSNNNTGTRGIWFSGPTSFRDGSNNVVYGGVWGDLEILTGTSNFDRIDYRTDDFGSFSGSGSLNVNSLTGAANAAGIIETIGDQDAFTFTAIGSVVQFTVSGAALGGMLAPTLELIPIGAGSTPVVTVTPTNTSATLNATNVVPGAGYVLRVSPQGNAYGNIGQYTITGNVGAFASLSGGRITVTGYDTNNDILISYASGTDNIIVQNNVFGGSAIQLFPRSQVTDIVIAFQDRIRDDTIDLFGAYSALSIPVIVNAGPGNDTFHVSGTSGADLLGLVDSSHGFDNATPFTFSSVENMLMHSFAGADTFNISALLSTTSLTINADVGDDVVNLAPNDPFGVSAINGPVTIVGSTGADTLNVGSGGLHAVSGLVTYHAGAIEEGNTLNLDDGANPFFVDYQITDSSVTRTDPFFFGGVNFSGVNNFSLEATDGPNNVTLTAASVNTTIIHGNGGGDTFVIGGGQVGFHPASVFDGGEGVDAITFDDRSTSANSTWIVESGFVSFFGGVFAVSTQAVESVNCLAGTGNNTIRVVGDMSQNISIDGGNGGDAVVLEGVSNYRDFFEQNEDPPFHYAMDLDGGSGLNSLTVDDTTEVDRTYAIWAERVLIDEGAPLGLDFNYDSFQSVTFQAPLSDPQFTQFTPVFDVFGTSSDIPATHQMTILGSPLVDQFVIHPHDANGNLTIHGNLGISGGDEVDTLIIDDSGSTSPINYSFFNQFGPATTNISGLGAGGFGASSNIENITVNAGNGGDTFNISSFKSGSALAINGGGGNDSLFLGSTSLVSDITNLPSFHFNGQGGSDTFDIFNSTDASGFSYTRNLGTTTASNGFGTSYTLNDSNIEQLQLWAGPGVDGLYLDAAEPGLRTIFNAGNGLDGLAVGFNVDSLENIRGPIVYNAGLGGGFFSLWDSLDTSGDTFHFNQSSVGAQPSDNLFGPGGSLTFSDVVNSVPGVGALLSLGSGADTVFAEPLATAKVTVNGNNPAASPGDAFRLSLAGVTSPVFTANGPGAGTYTFGNAQAINYTGFETASAYLPGDYSGNNVVGPEDFNIWKGNFGMTVSPGASGDGNGDGKVDAADYTLWRDRLGAMTPGGGAGSSSAESTFASTTGSVAVRSTTDAVAANLPSQRLAANISMLNSLPSIRPRRSTAVESPAARVAKPFKTIDQLLAHVVDRAFVDLDVRSRRFQGDDFADVMTEASAESEAHQTSPLSPGLAIDQGHT